MSTRSQPCPLLGVHDTGWEESSIRLHQAPDHCSVTGVSLIRSATVWHYRQYGTRQVGKIASYLYEGTQVYLDRKYQRAQQIIRKALPLSDNAGTVG